RSWGSRRLARAGERSGARFGVVPRLATCIASTALAGLLSYVALRRTREISIRTLLGATQSDVLGVLSAEFLRLLALSAILATGFGIWFSEAWLKAFANRT